MAVMLFPASDSLSKGRGGKGARVVERYAFSSIDPSVMCGMERLKTSGDGGPALTGQTLGTHVDGGSLQGSLHHRRFPSSPLA